MSYGPHDKIVHGRITAIWNEDWFKITTLNEDGTLSNKDYMISYDKVNSFIVDRKEMNRRISAKYSHQVNRDLIDEIHDKETFEKYQPELSYLAQKVHNITLMRMIRLVPIATKGECTCCNGGPRDACAIILQRAFEIDPEFSFLRNYNPDHRWLIMRHASSIDIVDFEPEKIMKKYKIKKLD